jgi:hypothetical protein
MSDRRASSVWPCTETYTAIYFMIVDVGMIFQFVYYTLQSREALGRAVQVDLIKPTLKAPGIELLKLKYGKPL